jgi:hypothetical protein
MVISAALLMAPETRPWGALGAIWVGGLGVVTQMRMGIGWWVPAANVVIAGVVAGLG